MNAQKLAYITKQHLRQNQTCFNDYTIKEIAVYFEEEGYVENLIKQVEECSYKTLEGIFYSIKKCKKKIKGEMKNFIIDHIYEQYDLLKQKAKFFYNHEEDKTNKYHLRRRREIVKIVDEFIDIFNFTCFTLSTKGEIFRFN